jgi:hypothetical protein
MLRPSCWLETGRQILPATSRVSLAARQTGSNPLDTLGRGRFRGHHLQDVRHERAHDRRAYVILINHRASPSSQGRPVPSDRNAN